MQAGASSGQAKTSFTSTRSLPCSSWYPWWRPPSGACVRDLRSRPRPARPPAPPSPARRSGSVSVAPRGSGRQAARARQQSEEHRPRSMHGTPFFPHASRLSMADRETRDNSRRNPASPRREFRRRRRRASVTSMRLGVFGKILLALDVLLLAFAGNATFTLLSIHRARQGVVANEAYLELQGSVDAAWKSLNDFAPALGAGHRAARPQPAARPAHGTQAPGRRAWAPSIATWRRSRARARRPDFEAQAAGRSPRSASSSTRWRASWAPPAVATDPRGAPRVREPLRDPDPQPEPHAAAAARRERPDRPAPVRRRGDGAVDGDRRWAAAGLAVAGAALHVHAAHAAAAAVLRARARQVAGGDYAQRTGRHVAGRDRRSGARVRRHGGGDPGARATPDPLGATGHGRPHGGADRPRGPQPAGVDRP